MKSLNVILVLFVAQLLVNCNNRTNNNPVKTSVEHYTATEEVDDVEPPPPGLTSNFKTLQDWLAAICKTENPQQSIATFRCGLFESANEYTVFLVGENKEQKGNNSFVRIDFEPVNMYWPVPIAAHKNKSREQIIEQLTDQLQSFIKSDLFKKSFFTKATSITTDFNGEIWSNRN